MATIGDGLVAFAVAFVFVGIFWAISWNGGREQITDYQKCIQMCPSHFSEFTELECPKMCAELHQNNLECDYLLNYFNDINQTLHDK